MLDKPKEKTRSEDPVVIKKYANRRLYNTDTSTYVTLDDLAQMVRSDRDFVVYDAKTGDELTHSVLTQIIVEQESKSTGPSLLPTPFLRQLIRFYDDVGVSPVIPSYLQMSLEALAREQERFREQVASSFHNTPFEVYNEQIRKNVAMFEQAMRMWSPTAGMSSTKPADQAADETGEDATGHRGVSEAEPRRPSELDDLRNQLSAMQARIEALARDKS